jgi:hypothetical protein
MKATLSLLLGGLICIAAGCGEKKSDTGSGTNTAGAGSSPLTAPVDYLDTVAKSKIRAEKVVDTASLNQAIQMFRVEQGRNPKDLDELVAEKVITRLPDPPYGMKFTYDATSGTVKVVPK